MVLIAVALLASWIFFERLPDPMATHWGATGRADAFMTRSIAIWLLPAIMIVVTIIALTLPLASPARFEMERFEKGYVLVVTAVLLFLVYAHALMLWANIGEVNMPKAVFTGIFLLFILFGNYCGTIRRNAWMGIRLPWTLASEENWNRTHRFAGKVLVLGGVLGVLLSMMGLSAPLLVSWLLLLVMVAIPYSVGVSKKESGSRKAVSAVLMASLLTAIIWGALSYGLWYIAPRSIIASRAQIQLASQLVQSLKAADFGSVHGSFDETMKTALTAERLQSVWQDHVNESGALMRTGEPWAETHLGFTAIFVPCEFERGRGTIKVVLNARQEVSGLWFQPALP